MYMSHINDNVYKIFTFGNCFHIYIIPPNVLQNLNCIMSVLDYTQYTCVLLFRPSEPKIRTGAFGEKSAFYHHSRRLSSNSYKEVGNIISYLC